MTEADSTLPQQERLTVRVPTAMTMLGLGRTKLYEMIGQGEIETIKVGNVTLVIVQSLRDFIDRQRVR
jgi:hypothetical protein